MEYELFYLVGETKEQDLEKIKKDVEEIVTKEGGSFVKIEVVKKRKMSYEIGGEIRGTYIARRFEVPSKDEREEKGIKKNVVEEVTRKMNLYSGVVRFLIVKADELPELKIETEEGKEEKTGRKEVRGSKKERTERKEKPKKVVREKVKEEKKEVKKKEKKQEEDIDKKLDELLNI